VNQRDSSGAYLHQVVIVEDDDANRALMERLVAMLGGCDALAFPNAQAGLDWCCKHPVDLLIVDYAMPGMDGLEFLHQLRAMPDCAAVPVLMVTSNDQKQVRYRALDAGANDYLIKPIDRVEFLARAKNMLVLAQAQRSLRDKAQWLADEVQAATAEILARERETVFRLAKAAEYRDPETGAHILRMAHYSQLIARQLGLSKEDQDLLLEAAPMHDIGKVGILDKILLKPGRLDGDEFEIMKEHAMYGWELLRGSASKVLMAGAEIAKGHHEKFDGSGYPLGLKGADIPIFSRIVAVADVFDALTSDRPYKQAWDLEQAVDFLVHGSGTHFDPLCVKAFFNAWDDIMEVRARYQDEEDALSISRMLSI
jgi:response regulator RpfG family c-di-GMP phosphodiesterase